MTSNAPSFDEEPNPTLSPDYADQSVIHTSDIESTANTTEKVFDANLGTFSIGMQTPPNESFFSTLDVQALSPDVPRIAALQASEFTTAEQTSSLLSVGEAPWLSTSEVLAQMDAMTENTSISLLTQEDGRQVITTSVPSPSLLESSNSPSTFVQVTGFPALAETVTERATGHESEASPASPQLPAVGLSPDSTTPKSTLDEQPPRLIVMVSLDHAEGLMNDVAEAAVKQAVPAMINLVRNEIEYAAFVQKSERRAAEPSLRSPF